MNELGPSNHFGTEPPNVTARRWKRQIGERLSAGLMPVIRHAARPYLGGEAIEDALCVAARLEAKGFATAFSYWDSGQENLVDVESTATHAMAALSHGCGAQGSGSYGSGRYLSLKPPALRFSPEAACRLASAAAANGVRLHFDSHGAEVCDQHNAMLHAMSTVLPPSQLGTTLPGRLLRSSRDAQWAITQGLNVRVVKGEWPDPQAPGCDLRQSFLALVDQLSGQARHVAVATHDLKLAQDAIARLRAKNTPCELEVLLGLASEKMLGWAKAEDIRVRIYIPYGRGFIPNAIGVLRRNPRLALAIAKAHFFARD